MIGLFGPQQKLKLSSGIKLDVHSDLPWGFQVNIIILLHAAIVEICQGDYNKRGYEVLYKCAKNISIPWQYCGTCKKHVKKVTTIINLLST